MISRPQLLVLLALGGPGLSGCHDLSSGGSSAPQVTNLGLAVSGMAGDGDLWLLLVSEADQGGVDLNLDGDGLDQVLHVLDLETGAITNTFKDVTQPPQGGLLSARGSLAAFAVSEAGEGGQDLNGDGDALDRVLHVYDHATETLRNLGIAVAWILFVDQGIVGFLVGEADQGNQDLDGDGAANQFVLHYYESSSGEVVNTGLVSSAAFEDGFIAVSLYEGAEDRDLNGDGDRSDLEVAHVYDTRTRTLENLGVAIDSRGLFSAPGLWVLQVREAENGCQDLNGDGDCRDVVLHTWDTSTRVLANTGLTVPFMGGHLRGQSAGGHVLLYTSEEDGLDRNGDGDVADALPVLLEPATGARFDPGLAIDLFFHGVAFAGELLGLAVDETRQGLDLDGDGDLEDHVLHVVDPRRRTAVNVGLDVPGYGLQAAAGRFVIPRLETPGMDLNGDGDTDDLVPILHDPRTNRTTSTGISTAGLGLGASDGRILFLGRERLAGGGFEWEYLLHDVQSQRTLRLGLMSGPWFLATLTPGGQAVLTVDEASQGADLNGDGDLSDRVAHALDARP